MLMGWMYEYMWRQGKRSVVQVKYLPTYLIKKGQTSNDIFKKKKLFLFYSMEAVRSGGRDTFVQQTTAAPLDQLL